jgi:hypothetical protein
MCNKLTYYARVIALCFHLYSDGVMAVAVKGVTSSSVQNASTADASTTASRRSSRLDSGMLQSNCPHMLLVCC